MAKANPGGSMDPKFIFGRDRLIDQIWDVLSRQCVLLNTERRIGKTSIVRKMAANPPEGWLAVFQDLEKSTLRASSPKLFFSRCNSTWAGSNRSKAKPEKRPKTTRPATMV